MKHSEVFDAALFDEFYGGQPQAIVWLRPIWSVEKRQIVDFAYTYANKLGMEYLSVTPDQLRSLTVRSSITLSEDLRKAVLDEMQFVYKTGKDSTTTLFNPALNKYARVLRSKLRGGILSVIHDITNEKRMIAQLQSQKAAHEESNRALNQQKTLLDNILKNSSNGISVSRALRNEQGQIVDALTILANDAAVEAVGLPRDIYLTRRATEIDPGIITSEYYQRCANTLATGVPFIDQYYVEPSKRWIEITTSRLDTDHLIHIFTDITPVKQAQLQVEQFADTLKSAFDAAQTGMFLFDPVYNEHNELVDFRFRMVNATVAAYVGRPPSALEGRLGSELFPGYLTNGVFDMYKHTFLTGEKQRRETHYEVDGHDNYLDLQCVKLADSVLVSLTDHTSLRKSQIQLQRTVVELERSNRYLEDFAHAASHDMKEPVRKILIFASQLKDSSSSTLSETDRWIVGRLEASAQHLKDFVEDLLSFSYISAQRLVKDKVDLNDTFRMILSELEIMIAEKKAHITIEALPPVEGNAIQLQQLFQNLMSNALKYSSPHRTPAINVQSTLVNAEAVASKLHTEQKAPQYYLIEVRDNGIGFDERYAEQIFGMFERLHTKKEYSGTGIGLSIAQRVAANHHGVIWAESELDKGATFKVLLPAG